MDTVTCTVSHDPDQPDCGRVAERFLVVERVPGLAAVFACDRHHIEALAFARKRLLVDEPLADRAVT